MKELMMLDLDRIDIDMLAHALEDHSSFGGWAIDQESGEVVPLDGDLDGDEDVDPQNLTPIDPIPTREAYEDLDDFTAHVRDPRLRARLQQAIAGRGAFRRFKDALIESPEYRAAWFAFHDARMRRRAIRWLIEVELVAKEAGDAALDAHPDPDLSLIAGGVDGEAIARAVAADLRVLYGRRLQRVLLFGSWARDDANAESDIDLLVALDDMDSAYEELRQMRHIMWRHSFDNDTVVTAFPAIASDLKAPTKPVLIRALAEGKDVT